MNDINPGVDLSILDKANEAQDTYITNPNMKTADAYIQALRWRFSYQQSNQRSTCCIYPSHRQYIWLLWCESIHLGPHSHISMWHLLSYRFVFSLGCRPLRRIFMPLIAMMSASTMRAEPEMSAVAALLTRSKATNVKDFIIVHGNTWWLSSEVFRIPQASKGLDAWGYWNCRDSHRAARAFVKQSNLGD